MTKNFKNKATAIFVSAVLGLGVTPALASAQDTGSGSFSTGPTADQYDPPITTFESGSNGNDDGGGSSGGLNESVGPLPFTGFDVIAMLAVALAVTGLGLALQRAVSREPRDLK